MNDSVAEIVAEPLSDATLEALSHFEVTANFDIKGSDCCGSPFMDTSSNQCAEKCFGDVHCMGWSHQDDVSACWLKYNVESVREKADVTSGRLVGQLMEKRADESKHWDMAVVRRVNQPQRLRRHRRGDEAKIQGIFLLLLFTMLFFQMALHSWRRNHPKSYTRITLAGMCVFPPAFALYFGFYYFFAACVFFAATLGAVVARAQKKPMEPGTPRLVYRAFEVLYNVCYAAAVSGFVVVAFEFFTAMFTLMHLEIVPITAFVVFATGAYFGVLGRDVADLTSEHMAASIGYTGRSGNVGNERIPPNMCILCGQELNALLKDAATIDEPLVKLGCGHEFHETCIRGWAIIGKKDSCPVCFEKVDTATIARASPWERTSRVWTQWLDTVRYMVVWNPVIIIFIHFTLQATGLDQVGQPPSALPAAGGAAAGSGGGGAGPN